MVIGRASSTWRSSGGMAGILWAEHEGRKQTRRGVAWLATPRRARRSQRYLSAASPATNEPLGGLLRAALLGAGLLASRLLGWCLLGWCLLGRTLPRGALLRSARLRSALLGGAPLGRALLRGRLLGRRLLGGRLLRR